MSEYTELKRLADAFPADLDWDSNTEPFFNGPSGESLGGGPTGFYCVYGPAFEIDDEQYDGPTYVESCKVDFAKFMVAARDGVLDLIAENARLHKLVSWQGDANNEVTISAGQLMKHMDERDQLKAENEIFEEGMRSLASTLGVGGYNAATLTATQLVDKVQWGVDHLADTSVHLADHLRAEVAGLRTGYEAYERVNAELKAEVEGLRKERDARHPFKPFHEPSIGYTGCVICGVYTDHGGLPCPKTRATADAALGQVEQS